MSALGIEILRDWGHILTSILRYEHKIEFKNVFAFVVFIHMAWLYHLGLPKIGPKWQYFFHEWQIFKRYERQIILAPPIRCPAIAPADLFSVAETISETGHNESASWVLLSAQNLGSMTNCLTVKNKQEGHWSMHWKYKYKLLSNSKH